MQDFNQNLNITEHFDHDFRAAPAANTQSQTTAMIVVPCYNEAERLQPDVFLDYLKSHQNVKFLFVNDGSKDQTLALLYKMEVLNPSQIAVLDLPENGGKAEAVRQGLVEASRYATSHIGYWDADLATPLNAIDDFLGVVERLNDIEIVFGARKSLLGHRIHRKISRRIVSRSCAILARFAVNLPVSDTQAGAKLFKNNRNLQNALSTKFTAGWLFDVELFARLARNMENKAQKFYEFPLLEWTEIPGSKVDMKAIIRSGFTMLKLIGQMRLGMGGLKTA